MKIVYFLGLILFIVGIILVFVRQFNEALFSNINEFWIDIMWPIGALMYSFALLYIKQEEAKDS